MMSSAFTRPATRRWVTDAAIAIAVAGLQLAVWRAATGHEHGPAAAPLAYVLLGAGGLALLARRRFPAVVLAVALGMALWQAALGGGVVNARVGWFVLVAAFVNAVLYRRRAAAIASLVIGYLGSVWPPWEIGSPGHASAVSALSLLAGLLALLSAAELIRARRQRTILVRNRLEEQARRQASEQRLGIARDLHDVVAHNISVINVQANTALHLMDRQPERAREALTAIHEVSRQALTELQSVLGVLRTSDGEAAPLAPSPGLDRLGELASGTAGIVVRLVTEGTRRPVPAGVDAAAYRIVQEALTNSVRHSGGRTATVQVSYASDVLTISVDDDGTGGHGSGPDFGNGLAGMTERARALGGTLEAGPRASGGFRVLARLPA
jgi:signal transduction histidine kinase